MVTMFFLTLRIESAVTIIVFSVKISTSSRHSRLTPEKFAQLERVLLLRCGAIRLGAEL